MTALTKPFIMLALHRTGTRMLCDALCSHPDIPNMVHEFNGTEEEFLELPYVLSNRYQDWMEKYRTIHIYRDSEAGARSMLLMSAEFPGKRSFDLPRDEIQNLVDKRELWDKEFKSDYSISYEEITGDEEVESFSTAVSEKLCKWLNIPYYELITRSRKPEDTAGITVLLADEMLDVGVHRFSTPILRSEIRQARMERVHYERLSEPEQSVFSWHIYEDGVRMGSAWPDAGKRYARRRGQRLLWQTLSGYIGDDRLKTSGLFEVVIDTTVPFHLKLYVDFM